MPKCLECNNTREFVRDYVDRTLHIYDENGDEVDSTSIGYELLPDAKFICNKCGSIDTEEG